MASKNYHYMKAGDTQSLDAMITRIVHISDTHQKHSELIHNIPDGDILIHSGDFSNFSFVRHLTPERDFKKFALQLNTFFSKMTHKYKIFVPGNHDLNLDTQPWDKVQRCIPSVTYLQDKQVVLDGIRLYGAGWNCIRACSNARGFAVDKDEIHKYWQKIPGDTDVLVTHSPPYGILDCSAARRAGGLLQCNPKKHCAHGHIGCASLKEFVLDSIKPAIHLFGHSHGGNLVFKHEDTVFSNAAMSCRPVPVVIDYHRPKDSPTDVHITQPQPPPRHKSACVLS